MTQVEDEINSVLLKMRALPAQKHRLHQNRSKEPFKEQPHKSLPRGKNSPKCAKSRPRAQNHNTIKNPSQSNAEKFSNSDLL